MNRKKKKINNVLVIQTKIFTEGVIYGFFLENTDQHRNDISSLLKFDDERSISRNVAKRKYAWSKP